MYKNFVRHPSEGTKGASLWAEFDAKKLSIGRQPTVDHAVGIAQKAGTSGGNARIEFRAWQTFHGVVQAGSWDLANLESADSEYAHILSESLKSKTDTREAWEKLGIG